MKMPRSSPCTTGWTMYTPAITSDSWTSANRSLLGEVDGRVNRSSTEQLGCSLPGSADVAERAFLQRMHRGPSEALFRLALVLAQVEEHEASVGAHDRLLTGRVLHLGDDLLGMVRVAEGVDPEAVEAHCGDGVEHLRRRLLHHLGLPVGRAAAR